MSEASITKGEWQACPSAEFDRQWGRTSLPTAIFAPPGKCEVGSESDEWPNLIAYVEGPADAQLFLAAKDLLAELEAALPLLHLLAAKMNTPAVVAARIESVKAAIRKATPGV